MSIETTLRLSSCANKRNKIVPTINISGSFGLSMCVARFFEKRLEKVFLERCKTYIVQEVLPFQDEQANVN